MAYSKQTWIDGPAGGTPISSARLGVLEQGVETAASAADAASAAAALRIPLAQRGVAGGVATLDAGSLIPDVQLPAGLARDTEVAAAVVAERATERANASATYAPKNSPWPIYATGIVVGGVTDNVAVIDALIAAAVDGDIIRLPAGRIKYGGNMVTGNKALTIEGAAAPTTNTTDNFGGAAWANALQTGTVLECTATSGAAITHLPTSFLGKPLNLRNLVIKGVGGNTRTTVGVSMGSDALTVQRVLWENVFVLNFATCVDLTFVENSQFDRLSVMGGATGLKMGLATNANTFSAFDAVSCAIAINLASASSNKFNGGAIQGSTGTGINLTGGSSANRFEAVYFENASAAYAVNCQEGADRNQFLGLTVQSLGDNIRVASNGNRVECIIAPGITVTNLGTDNVVRLNATGDAYPSRHDLDTIMVPVSQVNWYGITQGAGYFYSGFTITIAPHQNAEYNWDVNLAAGTWRLDLCHIKGADKGIVTVQFDGVTVGTIDGYVAGADVPNTFSAVSGIAVAQTKTVRVKLKMLTKNAAASSYVGAIQHAQLVRTA